MPDGGTGPAVLASVEGDTGDVVELFSSDDHLEWEGDFTVDPENVYWEAFQLFSKPVAGGAAKSLDPTSELGQEYPLGGMAVDDTHVYVATRPFVQRDERLFRVPKGGGNEEVLVARAADALVAVPGGLVALISPFTTFECNSASELLRVGTDGEVTPLGTHPGWARYLHADATHVYLTGQCNYDLARVPLAAGGPAEVVQTELYDLYFAGDSKALYYWASSGGLMKLAK